MLRSILFKRRVPMVLLVVAGVDPISHPALGQPKPPAIVPAPQAPTLTNPSNLGGRSGTTREYSLTGTELANPTGLYLSCPGTATFPTDNKNGTDPAKVRVKVELPEDTPVGVHSLRLITRRGVSNIRPFVVDDFPEVAEREDNHTVASAQTVSAPCVIVGRTDQEVSDFFRLKVTPGQRLTFEVLARRMGSPLDPIVLLHDGVTGKDFLDLYADDTPGLQSDCRLTHTCVKAGELVVEVRDSTHRGGGDFFYRLRVGDFPSATTAMPLAVERGKPAQIRFTGPDTSDVPAVSLNPITEKGLAAVSVRPVRKGGAGGWPVPVRVSDMPELVEQEPNDDPARANPLPVPGGVSASFAAPKDIDYFAIDGKKGQTLDISAMTFEVNAPTEVYIRVLDAKGAEVGRSNPQLSTARVSFTPPADGKYFIACEHLNFKSGPSEVYHLAVKPAGEVELTFAVDRFEAVAGGGTAVGITPINRPKGDTSSIDLEIVGAPGLSGSAVVPAAAQPGYLPLLIGPGVKPGVYPFRVRGKTHGSPDRPWSFATGIDLYKAALGGMPNPPVELTRECVVAVLEEMPFVVIPAPTIIEKGKTGKLAYTVKRGMGFDGDITVTVLSAAPEVTAAVKPIPKGQTAAEIPITLGPGVGLGKQSLVLRASGKVGGKDYTVTLPPIGIEVTVAKK